LESGSKCWTASCRMTLSW